MKSLILQLHGTKWAQDRMIMAAILSSANAKLHLNLLMTFGTSMKKLLSSASLEVAPHVMLISNICASKALET